jgi:ribose 5-phosphate isomerase B
MIGIGNDHIGFELKKAVIEVLDEYGLEYKDFGCFTSDRAEYPVFAQKVAKAVVSGECDRGILLCGTGVGISIAANKVKGIRAVVCSEPYSAKLAKEHNNANILAMGARVIGTEMAKMILRAWLDAEFEGGRHQNRVDLISKIENGEML